MSKPEQHPRAPAKRGPGLSGYVGKSPRDAEAAARNLWATNPAIREEFLDEAGFVGYAKAVAAGRVKVPRGGEL